jgi:hypothetical protein
MRATIHVPGLFGCFVLGLSAQAAPDFSGRWTAVEPASSVGQVLVITQDRLTIRLQPEGVVPETSAYALSGEPTSVKTAAGHRVLLTATWRDGKLMLTDAPTDLMYLREQRTLTLDAKGRLVLEKPLNSRADDEPAVQSQRVLEERRVVFEKR